MKIPLHIPHGCTPLSPQDAGRVLNLYETMMRANPKGFRTPSKRKGVFNGLQNYLFTLRVIERYGVAS